MVLDNSKQVWRCPYCDHVYNTYEQAQECATECAMIDEPEEDTVDEYQCELCFEKYTNEEEAILCEAEHKEKQDLAYEEYLYRKSREKLDAAANVQGQKRLGEF